MFNPQNEAIQEIESIKSDYLTLEFRSKHRGESERAKEFGSVADVLGNAIATIEKTTAGPKDGDLFVGCVGLTFIAFELLVLLPLLLVMFWQALSM